MLVLDSQAQDRWQEATKRENSVALRQQALEQEIKSNTITVEDDAGRDTSDLLAQMGRPLTSVEVQRRLLLCNPQLIFERCIRYPELTGVYIEKSERSPAHTWVRVKKHLFGMESGIMPEFSVKHKTKKAVPNKEIFGKQAPIRDIDWDYVDTFYAETRGWRTVLIRLLHLKLITQYHVQKHFGWEPSKESKAWANLSS